MHAHIVTAVDRTDALSVRFDVAHEYCVYFGRDLLAPDHSTLARSVGDEEPSVPTTVTFVLDEGLARAMPSLESDVRGYARAHARSMELRAPPVCVPGSEICKNDPRVLDSLYRTFHELGLDRHSVVVAIGGGAVLDVVGYAVATTHRGLRLVRVPTTSLAQCDAGIGVKNGVNRFGKKNFLGAFAPPRAVLVDSTFLRTLAPRDLRAGFAEGVKVALLRDGRFFEWLCTRAGSLFAGDENAVEHLVRRSAMLHLEHIARGGDPFESGSSRPLDLGHWAAHKLETLTQHALRHGEAVAIGIALDTTYAALVGVCEERVAESVLELFERLGLPIAHEALGDPRLMDGLAEFREHLGGELTIPLVREVGACVDVGSIDEAAMQRARERLVSRARIR